MTKTRSHRHVFISISGGTVLVNVTLSLSYLRNTVDGSIVSLKMVMHCIDTASFFVALAMIAFLGGSLFPGSIAVIVVKPLDHSVLFQLPLLP